MSVDEGEYTGDANTACNEDEAIGIQDRSGGGITVRTIEEGRKCRRCERSSETFLTASEEGNTGTGVVSSV